MACFGAAQAWRPVEGDCAGGGHLVQGIEGSGGGVGATVKATSPASTMAPGAISAGPLDPGVPRPRFHSRSRGRDGRPAGGTGGQLQVRARDAGVGQLQVGVGVAPGRDRGGGPQRQPAAGVEAGDDPQLESRRGRCVDVVRGPARADRRALVEPDLLERQIAVAEAAIEHESRSIPVPQRHQQVPDGRLRVDQCQLNVDRLVTVAANHDAHSKTQASCL